MLAGRFSDQRSQSGVEEPIGSQAGVAAQPVGAETEDELVRLIADRVYQRLMQELRIERERMRLVSKHRFFHKGGR